jgi:branched-subunit amino acid ABC-type transport system permease component
MTEPAQATLLQPGTPAHRRAKVALLGTGMATFALLWSAQPLLVLIGQELSVTATLATPLWAIWAGLLLLAGGFFVAHAVASSTVARVAPRRRRPPAGTRWRTTSARRSGACCWGMRGRSAWGGTAVAALVILGVAGVAAAGLPRRPTRQDALARRPER